MLLRTLVASGLKANKGTFIGLALLMALMSTTLTLALCSYVALNARQADALAETHAGDVLLVSSTAELSDDFVHDVEGLAKVDEVKVTESLAASTNYRSASGERLGEENVLNVTYMPWNEAIDFNVVAEDDTGIKMITHEEASAPRSGEIYVPLGVQPTLGLALGDTVSATVGDEEYDFVITQFIEEPQLGSPFVEMGQYLVSDGDFAKMRDAADALGDLPRSFIAQAEAGIAYPARTLNIYMTDEERAAGLSSAELATYIDENVNTESLSTGFLSAEMLTGYAMLVVTICCAMFLIFALFMYVIALVIAIHAISSAIQDNYVNFAILKAVGVPSAAIRRSFVVQYVVCVGLGCVVGLVVGFALTGLGLPLFAQLTGVLAQSSLPGVEVYVALAALVLLVVGAVYAKTRKVARISPLSALRSGMSDVHFKGRASVSVAGRPLGLRLAWRSLVSAKKSYVGLFACALLLGAFVMMTFGIGGSLRTMDDSYKAFGTWRSDVSVKLADGVTIDEVEAIVEEASPISLVWQEGFSMQNIHGESRSIVGLSDFKVTDGIAEGKAPAYDNEVVIGYKLAEAMDLGIGDELMLPDASGNERPYLVSGFLSAMFNAGYGILMTYDGLADLRAGNDAAESSSSWQMRLEDSSQADRARELLHERFGDDVDTTATGIFVSTEDLMVLIHDMFIFIGYGMDIVAVLLAILAVTLIIRRMFDTERRDLGIYKAVGFTTRRLRSQFALRFLIVSLAGCIVAAVLVSAGGSWVASQLFGTFGVTKFAIDTSPLLIGGLACALALVFFLAAFWSARKISRISTSILITD